MFSEGSVVVSVGSEEEGEEGAGEEGAVEEDGVFREVVA